MLVSKLATEPDGGFEWEQSIPVIFHKTFSGSLSCSAIMPFI